MGLEQIIFGAGGWIVAVILTVDRIRQGRRFRTESDRLRRLTSHLIDATERQRASLDRLVALGQPGSEVRDEAVTALQVAKTAVDDVVRAEPGLKPGGPRGMERE